MQKYILMFIDYTNKCILNKNGRGSLYAAYPYIEFLSSFIYPSKKQCLVLSGLHFGVKNTMSVIEN